MEETPGSHRTIYRLNKGVLLLQQWATPQTLLSSKLKGSDAFYKVTQEAHTGTGSHQGKGNLTFREEIPAGL